MINKITDTDILFTGHTNPAFDKSVKETMENNGETILIVRLNDYFYKEVESTETDYLGTSFHNSLLRNDSLISHHIL